MQTAKFRILCVDHNDDTRFIVSTLLKQSDYAAVTANSIRDALRLAEQQRFDLYILDQVLPDGAGADLCKTLRAFNRHAPVIFYAEDASEFDRQHATRSGAQGYEVKPNVSGLLNTVHRLLGVKKICISIA